MPDQSVVEELLEKGARAVSPHAWDDDNGWTPDTYADVQGHARAIAGLVADAMFPGWREGITREHAIQMSGGGYQVRNPSEAVERVYPLATWIEHQQKYTKVYQRDVVELSPWVPVEEGTDG